MLRRFILASLSILLLSVPPLRAAVNAQLVYDDARVIRRVAEVGGRAVPREIIEKIAKEDLDTLRGRRFDDTFEFARYDREEASRESEGFKVGPKSKTSKQRVKADNAYRLILTAPKRRYLVRHNAPVFVERVVLEMSPYQGEPKYETIEVGSWIQPGSSKTIDLPDIMKRATATVFAYVDDKSGVGALEIEMLEAKIVDYPDSPYASAVRNVKQILESLRRDDTSNLTALSNLILVDLGKRSDVSSGAVVTSLSQNVAPPPPPYPVTPAQPPPAPSQVLRDDSRLDTMPSVEIYMELQAIEDLLTGTEAERREGMDKLHQLVRKLR